MRKQKTIDEIMSQFPKSRKPLPDAYQKIYEQHYSENRKAATKASKATAFMESWCHKHVAKTSEQIKNGATLEIGAGTLNQFKFEKKAGIYDIVEPYSLLFQNSPFPQYIWGGFVFHHLIWIYNNPLIP